MIMKQGLLLSIGFLLSCLTGYAVVARRHRSGATPEPGLDRSTDGGSHDDTGVAFSDNNGDGDGSGGASDDRNSGTYSVSSFSSSSDKDGTWEALPDFVRVEIEIQRLENPGGILANGKKCDLLSACDPRVSAVIDADRPMAPFPGSTPVSNWPVIFSASNTNSPTIGQSVTKDMCGGAFGTVNLRVHVVDVDSFSANDNLMDFNCIFDVDPRDIAGDAQSASWGPSTECQATAQNGKIKLFVRERAYQIPASNCQVAGSFSGSSSGSMMASQPLTEGTSSSSSASMAHHIPGRHDYIRVDVELEQLLDPAGVAANGQACDLSSACDPQISAYLDIDKPLTAWPGSKTVPEYATIFKVSNTNSPIINRNVSQDICGGSLNKVNLRVHVVDGDTVTHSDPIGDFQCSFAADYSLIAPDISSSDWSPTQDCDRVNIPASNNNAQTDIRLQFRYRLYDIQPSQCGIKNH